LKNSIIIPTYNNLSGLQKCIESIIKTTDMSKTDVWIVSNGASEESRRWTSALDSRFHSIICTEALGYTKAVNLGLMASDSENVILLNDDIVILDWGGGDDWIRILTNPLVDKSIAVTGSNMDWWAKGKPFMVFFCVSMRREVVKELGYLDDIYNPGVGEDIDFCLKAQQRGYRVVQVPEQVPTWGSRFPMYHVGHVTCGVIPDWQKISVKNGEILQQRYPRTDEDRNFQTDFSAGRQNFHRWAK
jgi:GT2 family glycosyltransferase